MSAVRTLLVDDERLARAELKRLLQIHPQIEVVGEAANVEEASQQIKKLAPDLLFLDVQMPGGSGMDLANQIDGEIQIIFCTAHDGFAVEAFGFNALDYVLKPVEPQRLAKAIARIKVKDAANTIAVLHAHDTILLKFGEQAKLVRVDEIDRIDSVGNHAQLHTKHGKSFVLSPLSRIEQRLNPGQFVRVNRATILSLSFIDNLTPSIGYGLTALLKDGSEVEISRRAAQALKNRLDIFSL